MANCIRRPSGVSRGVSTGIANGFPSVAKQYFWFGLTGAEAGVYILLFGERPWEAAVPPGEGMTKAISEKVQIETEFGPLWSGGGSVSIGDRIYTMIEMKRGLELGAGGGGGIDTPPPSQ